MNHHLLNIRYWNLKHHIQLLWLTLLEISREAGITQLCHMLYIDPTVEIDTHKKERYVVKVEFDALNTYFFIFEKLPKELFYLKVRNSDVKAFSHS